MINRRKFLAFLGATVASPALAKVIPPASGHAMIGEVGPEVINLPGVVSAEQAARRGIMLRWSPAMDARSYHVYRNGEKIARVIAEKFIDVDVDPGRSYTYRVTREDEFGNVGAPVYNTSWTDRSIPDPELKKKEDFARAYGMSEARLAT